MQKELPLFTHWYELTGLVLERAGRFPKGLRPTLGNRLIDTALEALRLVVRLRYTKTREPLFRETNLVLEELRVLVRLSFERRLLSAGQYERLAGGIDTGGRMLGGWQKSVDDKGRINR